MNELSGTRIYPRRPVVGVGILIQDEDKYLLIKRAAEPDSGLWSIPGGLIEVGEKTRDAAKREVLEETGLEIKILYLLDVIDKIVSDEKNKVKYHFVIIDYMAQPIKGDLKPQDDALDARWVHPRDFHEYSLSSSLIELLDILNIYEPL